MPPRQSPSQSAKPPRLAFGPSTLTRERPAPRRKPRELTGLRWPSKFIEAPLGTRLKLSEDGSQVTRQSGVNQGICFLGPLAANHHGLAYFEVEVTELEARRSQTMALGFCCSLPPKRPLLTDRAKDLGKGSMLMGYDVPQLFAHGSAIEKLPTRDWRLLRDLRVGNIVGILLDCNKWTLSIYCDAELKISTDIPRSFVSEEEGSPRGNFWSSELYGVVDVHGAVRSVRLGIPELNDSTSQRIQESDAVSEDLNPSPPASETVTPLAHSESAESWGSGRWWRTGRCWSSRDTSSAQQSHQGLSSDGTDATSARRILDKFASLPPSVRDGFTEGFSATTLEKLARLRTSIKEDESVQRQDSGETDNTSGYENRNSIGSSLGLSDAMGLSDMEVQALRERVIELESRLQEAELWQSDPDGDAGCSYSCCCRHWKLFSVSLFIWIAAIAAAYLFLPSYVVNSRLSGAQISLESIILEIDKESSNFVRPRLHVSVPQPSFEVELEPFEAIAWVSVDNPEEASDANPSQIAVPIGTFKVSEKLKFKSGSDAKLNLDGDFNITGLKNLGLTVHKFITAKTVQATLTAHIDVAVKAWERFLYFRRVSIRYTSRIPAFNNFRTRQTMLDELSSAVGHHDHLALGMRALVFNPTAVSVHVRDNVQLKVLYNWTGVDIEVGQLSVPGFRMVPGMNFVNSSLTIHQTPGNSAAISEMITAYMGGVQMGFGPAATKPFTVTLADNGLATSESELVRTALKDFRVTMDFQPHPMFLLLDVTADVVVGKSSACWPPEYFTVTLNLLVNNPLPQTARLEKLHLSAYHDNLEGPVLYHSNRHVDAAQFSIPPLTAQWMSFRLNISEVAVPTMLQAVWKLAQHAKHKQMTLGISAELHLIVDSGYRQQVNYKNAQVSAIMCYHVCSTPEKMCPGRREVPRTGTSLPRIGSLPAPLNVPRNHHLSLLRKQALEKRSPATVLKESLRWHRFCLLLKYCKPSLIAPSTSPPLLRLLLLSTLGPRWLWQGS